MSKTGLSNWPTNQYDVCRFCQCGRVCFFPRLADDLSVQMNSVISTWKNENILTHSHTMTPFDALGKQAFWKHCGKRRNILTHSHTMTPFHAPGKQAFWKHCGKRRNCSERAISPFPTVFSTRVDNFLPFTSNMKLSSANSFSLEESKICRLVMD